MYGRAEGFNKKLATKGQNQKTWAPKYNDKMRNSIKIKKPRRTYKRISDQENRTLKIIRRTKMKKKKEFKKQKKAIVTYGTQTEKQCFCMRITKEKER